MNADPKKKKGIGEIDRNEQDRITSRRQVTGDEEPQHNEKRLVMKGKIIKKRFLQIRVIRVNPRLIWFSNPKFAIRNPKFTL